MNFKTIPATAVAPTRASFLCPTPCELAKLAALHPDLKTKKHAQLVLRHNGFSANTVNVEELFESLGRMLAIRSQRKRKAYAHRSPTVSLTERLNNLRKQAVMKAAKSCLRHGAAGGHSMSVTLTNEPGEVGYEVVMDVNWDTYGGSFKGWRASEDHHHITVPFDWRTRVLKQELAKAGGLLTLTAQQLVSHGDIELFQATWVEQSRGFQVNVRQGVIARHGNESFHAENAKKAIAGLVRKIACANDSTLRGRTSCYELTAHAFVQRFERYGHLSVSASDAYATGACKFGVQSWCEFVGIDLSQQTISLARLLAGFQMQPLVEVRRTVLHVVAEHRRRNSTAAVEQK